MASIELVLSSLINQDCFKDSAPKIMGKKPAECQAFFSLYLLCSESLSRSLLMILLKNECLALTLLAKRGLKSALLAN